MNDIKSNLIKMTLEGVRIDMQRGWILIKDKQTGITITSAENYEYMEKIGMVKTMYGLIQSVFIECFLIELYAQKIIGRQEHG